MAVCRTPAHATPWCTNLMHTHPQELMAECDSPFLVKLEGTATDDTTLYMMMEVVLGGELFAYLQVRGMCNSTGCVLRRAGREEGSTRHCHGGGAGRGAVRLPAGASACGVCKYSTHVGTHGYAQGSCIRKLTCTFAVRCRPIDPQPCPKGTRPTPAAVHAHTRAC